MPSKLIVKNQKSNTSIFIDGSEDSRAAECKKGIFTSIDDHLIQTLSQESKIEHLDIH